MEDVFALLKKRRDTEYFKSEDELNAEREKERKHEEHLVKKRADYAKHKDEINARRRERYNSDPEYRAKRQSENHEGYEGNRAVRIMKACLNSAKARARDPEGFKQKRNAYSRHSKKKRMADPEKHADIIASNRRYYERNKESINAKKREQRRLKKEAENALNKVA